MTRCFISHAWRHGGHEFALRLADALLAMGIDAWVDKHDILPGQNLERRMEIGVMAECDVFLFVLAPATLASTACSIELDAAFVQRDQRGLQIVPILFRSCEEIPARLSNLSYVNFRDGARFGKAVEQLDRGIEDAGLIKRLATQLSDGDGDARAEAAERLGELRNPFTVPILTRRRANDSDANVQYWSAFALGQIGTPEALDALNAAKKTERHPRALQGIETGLREANPAR